MGKHTGALLSSKQAARIVIFDRRLLLFCSLLAGVGLLMWAASLASELCCRLMGDDVTRAVISCPDGVRVNETAITGTWEASLRSAHVGLWRSCKTLVQDTSQPSQVNIVTACRYHDLSGIADESGSIGPESDQIDVRLHNFNANVERRRACLGFALISGLLLLMAIFFSWYTIRVPRYTFKRVTACIYCMAAAMEMAVIQTQENAVEQEWSYFLHRGCHWHHSLGYILAWVGFIAHVLCSVGFLYTSTKKKKRVEVNDPLPGFDEAPQIMGR